MRAAVILALAALPPARASAATCHTYTPAEQADATLMCAAAVDYEFSARRLPSGRGRPGLSWRRRRRRERAPPRVAGCALQGGAQEARLFLPAPLLFFSRAGAPALELDVVASMASVRSPRRRADHQRDDASRERAAAVSRWHCSNTHERHAGLSTHATCGATSQPCQATCDAVSSVCPAHVLTDLGVTCSADATTCVSGQDVVVGAVTEAYEGTACAGLVTW